MKKHTEEVHSVQVAPNPWSDGLDHATAREQTFVAGPHEDRDRCRQRGRADEREPRHVDVDGCRAIELEERPEVAQQAAVLVEEVRSGEGDPLRLLDRQRDYVGS